MKKKTLIVIFLLVLPLTISAQVELYFPKYNRYLEAADVQKKIMNIKNNDTILTDYFATSKHKKYNFFGRIVELKDYQYNFKNKHVYNYGVNGLSGSKVYSAKNKLLLVTTISYITNDSIVEVMLTPKLKPLATKTIVRKTV